MRQDAIFSFFSDNSVIQRITTMSEYLSWKEKERERTGERNPTARGHLCIKNFPDLYFFIVIPLI